MAGQGERFVDLLDVPDLVGRAVLDVFDREEIADESLEVVAATLAFAMICRSRHLGATLPQLGVSAWR